MGPFAHLCSVVAGQDGVSIRLIEGVRKNMFSDRGLCGFVSAAVLALDESWRSGVRPICFEFWRRGVAPVEPLATRSYGKGYKLVIIVAMGGRELGDVWIEHTTTKRRVSAEIHSVRSRLTRRRLCVCVCPWSLWQHMNDDLYKISVQPIHTIVTSQRAFGAAARSRR